jgi:hypothetical protein
MKFKLVTPILAALVLVTSVPALASHETPPGANPECFEHDGSTTSPSDAKKKKKKLRQNGNLTKAKKKGLQNRINEWNECEQWFIDHPDQSPPENHRISDAKPSQNENLDPKQDQNQNETPEPKQDQNQNENLDPKQDQNQNENSHPDPGQETSGDPELGIPNERLS